MSKTAIQQKKPVGYALILDSERVIGMVNGTMGNMPLSDEDIGRLRTVLRGEVTADEMVRQLVVRQRKKAEAGLLRV